MKERSRQYLVLGLGRFGESLAKSLTKMGHEVLAIDSDAELVEHIAPHVTQAIQINATDEGALQELGVRNFDAAIVSIGQNMRDSILVCVLLKELGVPYLIAKATDELHAKVLRKVGVDRVIFPERDMGMRLAKALHTPNVLELIDLSDDYQLMETILPQTWVGETIVGLDVRNRFGVIILAIHRGGQFIVSPQPSFGFEAGDILLVLGKKDDIDSLQ
ncbi:MAG: TrkA family potassium uptake protein [Candidatus Limiplasma sp.]|nr:TrkA family potassium uptake protein [Candidatus Limiplasma sp.]MEA5145799.1 TrkA family potassium uptake protein [Candidatus Limiplasma sp.]